MVIIYGGVVGRSFSGELIKNTNKAEITILKAGNSISLGGIAGEFYGGVCQNNYNAGDVIAKADNWSCVGGFIGECYATQLKNCYNSGNLIVEDIIDNSNRDDMGVGSLFGYISAEDGCIYENFYNTGNTTIHSSSDKANIGEIIGEIQINRNTETFKIKNCYIAGKTSITYDKDCAIGKIIGGVYNYFGNDSYQLTIENCYYLGDEEAELCGESLTCNWVNCGNKTETEMKQPDFVTLLDKDNSEKVWKFDSKNINKGFPILNFQ